MELYKYTMYTQICNIRNSKIFERLLIIQKTKVLKLMLITIVSDFDMLVNFDFKM